MGGAFQIEHGRGSWSRKLGAKKADRAEHGDWRDGRMGKEHEGRAPAPREYTKPPSDNWGELWIYLHIYK